MTQDGNVKIAANIISGSFARITAFPFNLEIEGVVKRTTLWDSVLCAYCIFWHI